MSRIEENALFEALARAGDGALIADAKGRIVLWNHSAERLLGWSASEAFGRSCCELLNEGDDDERCPGGCPVAQAAARGGQVESFDVRARAKSGHAMWLNISTLTVNSDDDGPLTIHLFRETAERPALATFGAGDEDTEAPCPLTRREREVLRLLARGDNTRMAAERLAVSPATVRNHVQNLLGKLGVHSRLQAVAYANTHGLV